VRVTCGCRIEAPPTCTFWLCSVLTPYIGSINGVRPWPSGERVFNCYTVNRRGYAVPSGIIIHAYIEISTKFKQSSHLLRTLLRSEATVVLQSSPSASPTTVSQSIYALPFLLNSSCSSSMSSLSIFAPFEGSFPWLRACNRSASPFPYPPYVVGSRSAQCTRLHTGSVGSCLYSFVSLLSVSLSPLLCQWVSMIEIKDNEG
jgi:hypothetical protein